MDHWEFARPETIARIVPDGYPGIELEHASALETSLMRRSGRTSSISTAP
ncbi:hypothetical protein [Rhizobium leguminosarum]|nr:hypothetical protein [Rhizobium leguminosarum]MCH4549512.1 hypothetical protein [Rhizobium changzhiense]